MVIENLDMHEYIRGLSNDAVVASFFDMPPLYCSKYARLAAAEFGFIYNPGDAWDFAGKNLSKWTDILPVSWETTIQKGDILGIFNPFSKFNLPGRAYTHLAYYYGDNTIFHQFGDKIYSTCLDKFVSRDFVLKEIITCPKL